MTETNFATKNKFKIIIHYSEAEKFEFFIKSFTFGGMTIGTLEVNTPIRPMKYPGDSYSVDDCIIDFYIDENWEAYKELFRWIKKIKNGKTAVQRPIFADMTVEVLTTKYRPNFNYLMIDCFPMSLTPIVMDNDDSDNAPLMAQVVFKVNDYDIVDKN